ncbi:unnamed protein product [Sphagnum jensenii]|uniref:Transmembrane protein n=1 Tax=Sphagnum jensenii TaxID=128206 RepID=A0ABP0VQW5_9BRYO
MDPATKAERSAQVHGRDAEEEKGGRSTEVGEDEEEEEDLNGKLCYSHLQERLACRHEGHSRLRALYNRSAKLLVTLLRSSSIHFFVGSLVALVLRPTSIRILSSVFWWRFCVLLRSLLSSVFWKHFCGLSNYSIACVERSWDSQASTALRA